MKFSAISTKDKGSFISSREKPWDEHVRSILNLDRLKFRLRFLAEITLPQLAGQSLIPDARWFSFVVITSTLLPAEVRSELHSAAKGYPWLKIVERGPDDWIGATQLTKDCLCSMDYRGTAPFLSFRLDDDDTLSDEYLERSQRYICPDNVDKILTFTRGAKILWDSEAFAIKNYQDEHRPLIAIGLSAIAAFDFTAKDFASRLQTIFVGMNHYKIREQHEVIEDETPGMFIWSHHASQDTFGRFKSAGFSGEWDSPPNGIEEKMLHYPTLRGFVR